jgi:hypothetical protein
LLLLVSGAKANPPYPPFAKGGTADANALELKPEPEPELELELELESKLESQP